MAQALRLPDLTGHRTVRGDREYNGRQWSAVKGLQSPPWLKEIYDRICELETLQENWDSYGAAPVAHEAISIVRVVLSSLDIDEMPRPHIAAIPDGGVGLHWRVADRDLEIEIEPNGQIHFLRTIIGKEPETADVETWEDAQGVLDWVLGR